MYLTGGPTEQELLQLLNHCDVSSSSYNASSSSGHSTSLLDRVLLRSSMTSLDSFHSNSSGTLKRSSNPLTIANSSKKEVSTSQSNLLSDKVKPEAVAEPQPAVVAKPLSMYENLTLNQPSTSNPQKRSLVTSLSFSGKTKHDPDTKMITRTTSFSNASPVGRVPLPGMTSTEQPNDPTKNKSKKDRNNDGKKKHSRSHSLTEQQCLESATMSIKRQFSLKTTDRSENFQRSNSVSVKKKNSNSEEKCDQNKHKIIHEGESVLTPRNSTSRNSYKSAMQQDAIPQSQSSQKQEDDKYNEQVSQ